MIAYASNTQGKRNLAALHAAGWHILLTPGKHAEPPAGFFYAIDNGAWAAYRNGTPFDGDGFAELVDRHGGGAEFVIIPDKVAEGNASLEFSKSWLERLRHLRLILLPVQDGMDPRDVGALLERHPRMGIFLGGTTDYKLRTMHGWGMVAFAMRRYYHVGRVNTVKRIRLCAEAGADSFDGTSATMYSCTVPMLNRARLQPSLLSPGSGACG